MPDESPMDDRIPPAPPDHVDVLIVGAGLSGIGAAWHLQRHCPGRTYAIVEARGAIGGTWDMFRYPGIRSDSDMFTLGYSFRPWTGEKAIADGADIRAYVEGVARDFGIDRAIRFHHEVVAAAWSSADARWTVELARRPDGERVRMTCGFLFACSGYYDYDKGYLPDFPGMADYKGTRVHPQFWPEDIDWSGKRVLVIGSGATAMTLVPAMAQTAAHVTMVQRSPTYAVARPARDRLADRLRRRLPMGLAYTLTRWKNVLMGMYFYRLCRRDPARARGLLLGGVRQMLGPDYDVGKHFTPTYNPWTQRLCLIPDADLFRAIRRDKVSVVTDEIERFTATGLKMKSGVELDGDIVVTATGLTLKGWGGMALSVDGRAIDPASTMTYKGMMFTGVPNFALWSGYTNASWTLKADLVSEHMCRLLNRMQSRGWTTVAPRRDPDVTPEPWLDLSSNYILRSLDTLPKQGSKRPWKLYQNYIRDLLTLRFGTVADKALEFSTPKR